MEVIKFVYYEITYMIKAGADISIQKIGRIFNRNKNSL